MSDLSVDYPKLDSRHVHSPPRAGTWRVAVGAGMHDCPWDKSKCAFATDLPRCEGNWMPFRGLGDDSTEKDVEEDEENAAELK
jgi:hypothetical protein